MSEGQPDLDLGTPEPTPPVEPPAPEPTPPVEPTPAPSWRTALPAEMADHPSLAKYEDVPALAKGFLDQNEFVGRKGIIPPKEGASDEEVNAFYTALGRPETPGDYQLEDFAPPDSIKELWNAQGMDKMVEKMHARGASQEFVRGILEDMAEHQAEQFGDSLGLVQQGKDEAVTALKTKWGLKYDANIDLAKRVVGQAADAVGISREDLAGRLLPEGGMVGNDPVLAEVFALIGQQGGELRFLGDTKTSYTRTPQEAEQEIGRLEASPAFTDKRDPEHRATIEKLAALYAMQYPEEGEE